jgi:hypothetical protein
MLRSLALLALAYGATAQAAPPADVAAPDRLNPHMSQGFRPDQHVEVSPGMFLRRDLVDSGAIAWLSSDAPPTTGSNERHHNSCYQYASDDYSDHTTGGRLFGGDPSWSSYLSAYSSQYGSGAASHAVYLYSTTNTPTDADYLYAYSYLYVNGTYYGYFSGSATSATSTSTSGSFAVTCAEASVDTDTGVVADSVLVLELIDAHYAYGANGDNFSIGTTLTTTLTCCP